MSDQKAPATILSAIVSALHESRTKQATLNELYISVAALLGKEVHPAIIRATINRSLDTAKKHGPYPVLFRRVARGTYALTNR